MGGFFFYIITIAFAVGVFVRSLVTLGLPEITWLILIALVLALVWGKRRETPFAPHLLFLSIFLFAFAIGALRFEIATWSEIDLELERQVGTEVTLTGVVVREPDIRERTTHLYIEVEDSLVLVTTDRYAGEFAYGDLVSAKEVLERPEAFETDLGRTFNYPGYLLARGTSYVLPFAEVEVLESGQGNLFLTKIFAVKHAFMQAVEKLIPEPQAGLSQGLLLGVKRALGDDLEEVFRETGIIHIVVLSGYNVMIVVTFVMYVLGRLFGRRLSTAFGLISIALFAILVGLSATVLRASIMAGLLLIVGLTGRIYFVLRGLMLAGVVMLLFNPYLLVFDTGFQLSFVATLGLILAAPFVTERLSAVPTWLGAREFLTATLVTQIFVLPLLLYQIGEFSVVAVIVNVLVLPMVPASMLLTFITGMIGMVSVSLAAPLAFLTHLSLTYIIVIAEWFAGLPFASFVVPQFPFWLVPVAYAILAYAIWLIFYREEKPAGGLDDWTIVEEQELRKTLLETPRSSG